MVFLRKPSRWVLLVISAFCLWTEGNCQEVGIFVNSDYCSENVEIRTITCDLQNQRGKMLESKWTDRDAFNITNGASLTIQPQCDAEGKYLHITNTKNIQSQSNNLQNVQNDYNCQVYLDLFNCTATIVEDLFSLISVRQSSIDAIKLIVERFHLDDSSVGDVDIVSTSKRSTIIDSKVDTITRLEMQADYELDIVRSHIGKVRKFIYNSNYESSSISDTVIDKVFADGFEIITGHLILTNVTFSHLLSGSIVIDNGNVDFINVRIDVAYSKSIIMKGQGKITFQNVSIGDHLKEQYYQIKNTGSQELWPLAVVILHDRFLSTPESILIVMGIIMLILLVIIVGVIIKLKLKKTVSSSLSTEESKIKYISNRDSPHSTDNDLKTHCKPHETSANSNHISDDFEDYTDVEPPLPPPPFMPPANNMPESRDFQSELAGSWPPAPPPSQFEDDSRLRDEDDKMHGTSEDYLEPIPGVLNPKPHLPPDRKQNFLNREQRHDTGHPNPMILSKPGSKPFLHLKQNPPAPPKRTISRETLVKPNKEPSKRLPGKLDIHKMQDKFNKLPHPPKFSPTGNQRFADNMEDPEEIYESFPE